MKTCYQIVNKINKDKIIDYISLSYDQRFVRRKKLVSDNGTEFLVNLSETKSLIHNQAFKLEDEKLIVIVSNKEELIEITGNNLMQLIWHIGNRHMPCQIEAKRILIQNDIVIREMILKLGGTIRNVLEPFNPEGGAYGMGRTHGHKH